ncbi:MAG: hypothetical protein SO108_00910 [Bacilli bacterium]|nr:hypothetical protein [Bacilli bacterium]
MKKIFLILLLFVPSSVFALSLNCPDMVSPGEDFVCTLSETDVTGIKSNVELVEGIDYQKIEVSEPWKIYYQSKKGFVLGNIKENTSLKAKLSFKVNRDVVVGKEFGITLKEIEESDLEIKNTSKDLISSKIKVISDDNFLSILEVKNEKMMPKFQEDVMTYFVETERNQVEIYVSPKDHSSKLEGDTGVHLLEYGVNSFQIKVTSVRGNVKKYTIYVTRKIKNSGLNRDVSLKSLVINGHKISLEKNKYYYQLTLDSQEEGLNIGAIANHDKTKIEIIQKGKLEVGDNDVKIVLTAESGEKSTYLVHVVRKEKLSSDISLDDSQEKDKEVKNNQSSSDGIFGVNGEVFPLIVFILCIIVILVVKVIRTCVKRREK